ncbi:MAG: Zn-ribbon domain-containing OB-fold protein [Halobacteriales archaeon]|nr:Zn-ribbon domain-containing OB-fold protein [Halobacteriales archaeon]
MSDDRERVTLPDRVELPRLLDFYDYQTPEDTGIHEFYEHLRDGELTTTRCADCDAVHFPPRIVCPECLGDDLEYVGLPERGELFAFSEVRAGAPLGMEDDVPFTIGIVDLGEVRLSARIDGATSEELAIGDPVELRIVDVEGPADHDRVWFRFVPAEG